MTGDDSASYGNPQDLPLPQPIQRVRALLRYKFGLASCALLALSLLLTIVFEGHVVAWGLGAVTFVLLATGGVPESELGVKNGKPKPEGFFPHYSVLHYAGLIAATSEMLVAGTIKLIEIPSLIDALAHLCSATSGWILLRQAFSLISKLLNKIPYPAKFWKNITAGNLYLAACLSLVLLATHETVTLGVEISQSKLNFQIGALLILIPPALSFRSFSQPVTGKTITAHSISLIMIGFLLTEILVFDENLILDTIAEYWPLNFGKNFLTIAAFTLPLFLLTNLHKTLVIKPKTTEDSATLSIFPDPSTYVDDDGFASNVTKLITRSNSGVIGVTGVRGAGKSALLAKIKSNFERHYCVVWTVAPVSHRDDGDLSFLMSVCRTLCQKAIGDADKILYGRNNVFQQAGEEFLRRIRLPAVFVASFAGLLFLMQSAGIQTPSFLGQNLKIPEPYRLGGEIVNFKSPAMIDAFSETLAEERIAMTGLLSRINAALPPDLTAQKNTISNKWYAIVPLVGHRGFDLIFGESDFLNPTALLENHNWLTEDVRTAPDQTAAEKEFNFVDDFPVGTSNEEFIDAVENKGKIERYFSSLPASKDTSKFSHLQKLFYRQISGSRASIFYAQGSGDYRIDFEHKLIALTMLRGYPGLELHLGKQTSDLKDILSGSGGTTNPVDWAGVRHAEWASLVLLASYFDRIERLTSAPDVETKKMIAAELFMDATTLRSLREVLSRYLEIINGKTLSGGLTASGSGDAVSVGMAQRFLSQIRELDERYIFAFLGILALALLPELWRAGNFVVRGIVNFRLLVLVRESQKFLEDLDYSEGREASAGFSFKGIFNLGGKRTLTARALSLQSLTDRYQTYVDILLPEYNGKLIIIIDELDKMIDPKDVKKVLLELKGALFQRGCYYLMSISEDSARSFRGRLVEGRDIFESTFEDVITIDQMATTTARAMVANRLSTNKNAPQLSDEAVDALTVFSGAIPREIVRHLRDTILKDSDDKEISPWTIGHDIFEAEVKQWRNQLRTAPFRGEQLIKLRDYCRTIQDLTPSSKDEKWPVAGNGTAGTETTGSIGLILADCVEILDPDKKWRSTEIINPLDPVEDAESRNRFGRLAELQACLRLMIMNELLRFIREGKTLNKDQSRYSIECFRTVLLHPAITEKMLGNLSNTYLKQKYPEDKPPGGESDDLDAAAE